MAYTRFSALVANGKPVSLDIKVSSLSLMESSRAQSRIHRSAGRTYYKGNDKFLATGVSEQPYKFPNYRVTAFQAPRLLPVGFWRGVGESQNSFFHESIMDELAHAAGQHPLEMRLGLLEHGPSRKVLEAVGDMSDWGSHVPAGHARGLAYVLSSGAATAQVIEIKSTTNGIKIVKAYAAVDFGYALDPRNIISQVEGSLLYGLTAAIMGEITVNDGVVDQLNFHEYGMLRMSDSPPVEVKIIESKESIYGAGESGLSAIAPALGNAIFALTGQRLRELPFRQFIDFA